MRVWERLQNQSTEGSRARDRFPGQEPLLAACAVSDPAAVREWMSFLLAAVLSAVSMVLYAGSLFAPSARLLFPGTALLCAALGILPFLVCRYVNRHRLAGTFVLVLFLMWRYFAVRILIGAGQRAGGAYFWQWMISGGDTEALEISAGANRLLFAAMALAATLFFGITAFYFGAVLYRISFLTLVSLIPFVLYVKVIADVDNRYLLLVAFANLALHFANARGRRGEALFGGRPDEAEGADGSGRDGQRTGQQTGQQTAEGGYAAYLLGFALFALAVLLLSAAIPKREEARYYERFEDAFLGGDTASEVADGYAGLADFSGNADGFRSISNRRLYTVYGERELYLKRQVFDRYDFALDRWFGFDAASKEVSPEEWMERQGALSIGRLLRAMKTAAAASPDFAERYGLGWTAEAENLSDPLHQYHIRSQNFGAAYYLSAARAASISLPEGEDLHATDQGTYYRGDGVHAPDFAYSLSVYDSQETLSRWRALGGMEFSPSESLAMLTDMQEILQNFAEISENDSYLNTVLAFRAETEEAIAYRERTERFSDELPEKIRELSLSITADCGADWERAAVLERYFRQNGFLYDIEYRAPDDGPEYFLFTGKTGTCSDFASAYVLLARAAGLTVRYAEGYLTEESGQENYRYVTESNSHAYAEVFLANTGWIAFDPTAGVEVVNGAAGSSFWANLRIDYGLLGTIGWAIVLISVVILFLRVLAPLIGEGAFRLWLRAAGPERIAVPAYRRVVRRARRAGVLARAEHPTPGEFADRMGERGADLEAFVGLLERQAYGGRSVRAGERSVVCSGYAAGMRSLRARVRRSRAGRSPHTEPEGSAASGS